MEHPDPLLSCICITLSSLDNEASLFPVQNADRNVLSVC